VLLGCLTLLLLGISATVVFTRRLTIDIGPAIRITDIGRPLLAALVVTLILMASSPRARARLRAFCMRPEAFFIVSMALAWWLSLGPAPTSLGRPLGMPALYRLLYSLPGGDGLRVPARLAMVIALMLAVCGGFALARLPQRRNWSILIAAVAMALLVEASPSEFPVNGMQGTPGFGVPEARLYPPRDAPPIYRAVSSLDRDAILLELPIGDPNWDVRAVYYSTAHWRALINGYSGFFPPHYGSLIARLGSTGRNPDDATQALLDSGATHVLFHEQGFAGAEGAESRRWLESTGAREVAREGPDTLYIVRR
jgi:hypothetical protein